MRFILSLFLTTVVAGTEKNLPIQRLRSNSDVRWTFDYPGVPNDPESVRIDSHVLLPQDFEDIIEEDGDT